MNPVHFSTASAEWPTPAGYFRRLARLFNFRLDPCCTPHTAKCQSYFTAEEDGLSKDWALADGAVFVNPPYGRGIGAWVKKGYETAQRGTPVVMLLPARTDTAWWHEYVTQGLVKFLRGRLKFGTAANSAPFPSALVIFAPLDAAED